jgi:lysyl-tRNA synthetase class 2
MDIGDFIDTQGKVFKTKAGETSVLVNAFHLLTKSLRSLPSRWYGLKGTEEKYRQRYLDLIVNPNSKKIFETRAALIQAMREFLLDRGYIEVETPVLQPLYGGGLARPFKTYHNVLGIPLYMRISTELYLKRLIVGGFEKVFEFGRLFRNEGIDKNHNPEFTMLETMEAYIDYKDNMKLVEEMTAFAVKKAVGKTKVIYEDEEIDFKTPWKKLTMVEAVREKTRADFTQIKSLEQARKIAADLGVKLDGYISSAVGLILAAIFEEKIEPTLIQPTIIYDFPVETSPLAKRCPNNSLFVQRWEHFVAGMEMSNNYSELNDPLELSKRFIDERKKERLGDEETHQTDEDFIEAMEYGMPPTSGIGPGIDRLTLVICYHLGARNLRDVILFPTMRPEVGFKDDGLRGDKLVKVQAETEAPVELPMPRILGISREKALILLKKYLKDEKELNHLIAVEAAMCFYAQKFGGTEKAWALAGLLHDLDWDLVEGDAERHGRVAAEILEKEGTCQPIIYSILAHNEYQGWERKTLMDRALWASEELTGLILAVTQIMPDKSIYAVDPQLVLKKIKTSSFAASINRQTFIQGAEELGLSLEEHVNNVLQAMQSVGEQLGFKNKKGESLREQEGERVAGQTEEIFYIDSQVRARFPGMKAGVAIIEGVEIKKESRELEEYKKEVLGKISQLKPEEANNLPTIKAYRDIFRAFGVDWHSRHPSADALLRRVVQGKGLYKVNTLVDAYNLAVLESKIALGAFDFEKVAFPVILSLAEEGDEIVLLGETEPTKIGKGEMIYKDQSRVLTLDLNYRDGDFTKITPETKKVVLFADGCPEISSQEVMTGLEKGIELITRFCRGQPVKQFIVE